MRNRRPSERVQLVTPFTRILEQLVRACPGALGAAFVDAEGEAVDYAGAIDSFAIKIAAAHMRILLHEVSRLPALGADSARELMLRGQSRTFCIRAMPEGYAIVLLLSRGACSVSPRAMQVAERRLAAEAALPVRSHGFDTLWYPTEVETASKDHRRPRTVRLGTTWEPLDTILGAVAGLPSRERGYRVRLRSGAELTLIREPGARWYTDEPAAEPKSPSPPDVRSAVRGSHLPHDDFFLTEPKS